MTRPLPLGLAAVTVAAFGLRAWNLAGLGDLDFDEQASFFIGSMPPLEMLAYLVRAPFEHPPAFYLLFHLWLAAAGPSEPAMRLFSVLLGTLAVPVVGLAAGRAAGPRAGLVAAAFLAVMPLHVFYSRDARMYPLLALLVAIAVAAVAHARRKAQREESVGAPRSIGVPPAPLASFAATGVGTPIHPVAPAGASERGAPQGATAVGAWVGPGALALALATHYYAALALGGMGAGLLAAKWRRGVRADGLRERRETSPLSLWERVRAWLQRTAATVSCGGGSPRRLVLQGAAILVAGAAGAAWLTMASGLQTSLSVVYPRWVEPARVGAALVESAGAALAGPLASPWHNGAAAVLVVAMVALAAAGWRRGGSDPSAAHLWSDPSAAHLRPDPVTARLWWLALGGLLGVGVGVPLLLFLGREFAPRFVVLATPFLAVLVGLGSAGWSGRAIVGLSMVVGGAAILGLAPYYSYERSDYGRAMEHLRGLVAAGDGVVLNGPWQDMLYRRYGQGLPPGRIIASTVPLKEDETVGWLERIVREHPRVWVVDSATDAADPTGVVARWLDVHAYPRPVIEYKKALLRPYLTETGASGSLESRSAGVELLGMTVESVALERWALAPGGEARVRVAVMERCPAGEQGCAGPGERRLVLQLVGPSGQGVWHWDGALTRRGGELEYRGAIVVPGDAPAGDYELRATVHERTFDAAGAARVQRVSAAETVGLVRVTAPREGGGLRSPSIAPTTVAPTGPSDGRP